MTRKKFSNAISRAFTNVIMFLAVVTVMAALLSPLLGMSTFHSTNGVIGDGVAVYAEIDRNIIRCSATEPGQPAVTLAVPHDGRFRFAPGDYLMDACSPLFEEYTEQGPRVVRVERRRGGVYTGLQAPAPVRDIR